MYDTAADDGALAEDRLGDQRVRLRAIALVWLVPALLSAAVSYTFTRITGSQVSFWNVFVINIPIWYFWAFATPAIFWLGRKVRLNWPVAPAALAIHLSASLLAATLDVVCGLTIASLIGVTALGDHVFQRYLVSTMSWLVTGVLTYWAVLGVGYALEFSREYQLQLVRASQLAGELSRAQLAVLRNQLHPHFLFNTLNTAVSLVRVDRTETAVRVLTDLGEILRRLLHNAPDQEVALRDELAFLNAYIAIEKLRFADRLAVRICVPDDILGALVPNLLLQPLVENAIRYGVGETTSPGLVEVSGARQGSKLTLRVRDDGPGLPTEWHARDSTGVGLANTQQRLQQMYGPLHEFMVSNGPEGGAEVTITIPFGDVSSKTSASNGTATTAVTRHA